jgi:uncharacterized protein with HEPN domain
MQHDMAKYLLDIHTAAKDVQQFVVGVSFDEYHVDRLIKAAVERKFEIIGEAMNRLAGTSPDAVGQIREFEKIIAFRNLVIHGYDVVSDPLVWDVIHNKLPLLVEDIEELQRRHPPA